MNLEFKSILELLEQIQNYEGKKFRKKYEFLRNENMLAFLYEIQKVTGHNLKFGQNTCPSKWTSIVKGSKKRRKISLCPSALIKRK